MHGEGRRTWVEVIFLAIHFVQLQNRTGIGRDLQEGGHGERNVCSQFFPKKKNVSSNGRPGESPYVRFPCAAGAVPVNAEMENLMASSQFCLAFEMLCCCCCSVRRWWNVAFRMFFFLLGFGSLCSVYGCRFRFWIYGWTSCSLHQILTATDPVSQLSTYSMSTSSVVNCVNLTNWAFLHSWTLLTCSRKNSFWKT